MTEAPWELEECQERIKALKLRYEGQGKLHGRINWRRMHYHNLPGTDTGADPILPDIWAHAVEQTTLLEDTHIDMKARLLENRWLPEVYPAKDTVAGRTQAEEAEQALVFLFDQHRRRTGIDIQAEIVDGMGIDGPVYLHWRIDGYDEQAEYLEETDEAPECDMCEGTKRAAGKKCPRCKGSGVDPESGYTSDEYGEAAGRSKSKKYRESDDAAQERIMRAKAESGGPIYLEVVTGDKVCVTQDKSPISEFKEVLVTREIGIDTLYEETDGWTKKDWWSHLVGDEAERDAPIRNEQDTKMMDAPEASDWGTTVQLDQLWTREWCYELAKGDKFKEPLYRAIKHGYGMVPWSKAVGRLIKSDSPALAETSYLESMYRIKPKLDRTLSLRNALVESGAVPVYFIQKKDGKYRSFRDETGNPLEINEDSARAAVLGEGETIVRFGGEGVAASFENMVQQHTQQMLDARPSTGKAEFGTATKPFAALQQTRQENRQPKSLLDNVRFCLEPMVNNVMKMLGDAENGPGPVAYFPMANGEHPDTNKVMVLKPEQWVGLWGGVKIEKIDATERIANIAHLQELVNDELIHYPVVDFIGNGLGLPNPEQEKARWDVIAYVDAEMKPGIMRAEAAKWAGPQYVLTADGTLANMAGQQVAVGQAAQQMGARPIRQPAPANAVQPAEPTQMTSPPMAGTATTPGMPGIL